MKNAEKELEAIINEDDEKKKSESDIVGQIKKPKIEITSEETEHEESEATGGKEADTTLENEDKKSK